MKLPLLLAAALLVSSCSPASSTASDEADSPTATAQGKPGKKGKGKKTKHHADELPTGLREVGRVADDVREGSGLCPAPQPGTYFTFGDQGNPPVVFRIGATGQLLGQLTIGAPNHDWESLTRDESGTYYLGDCGNNTFTRRDLAILRFRPDSPGQVGRIAFHYPDQTEFPPAKGERNFDCEAIAWADGQVWLFTKDPADAICKVYSVPDAPGTYTARLVARLALPGRVTDAAVGPDGRLVLLARAELFVLESNLWEAIRTATPARQEALLKATPRRISLAGAGQTEGVAFKDDHTLLISTEQGRLYELAL